MKTCREIEQYLEKDLSQPPPVELSDHLTRCPRCAQKVRLAYVRRRLLQATLPESESLELSAGFLPRLRTARRQAQPGRWPFWESVWKFSKPFSIGATILVILIGGLNLFLAPGEEAQPLPMESYLMESDEMDLILSEEGAMTQERVLRTLMVVRRKDHGTR